jgi:Mor family transcriptional regulator
VREIDVNEIRTTHLNGAYREMAEVLGVDTIIQIHKHFRGLQMTFPTRLLSKSYVKEQVKMKYNGKNSKELARKYGYSERWIRNLAKE